MATLSDILRASTQANPGSAYPYRLPPEALASLLSSQQQAAAQGAQSFNMARAQSRQDRMNAALRAKELEMGYDQKRREMANQQTEALNMRNWMEQQAAQDFQRKMQEQAAQFEQESSLESLRQKYKADAAKSLQEHNMAIAMKEIEVRQAKNQNEHDAAMRELDDLKQSRQNKLDFDIKGREMEEKRRERERGESIFAAIGERRKARKAEEKADAIRKEERDREEARYQDRLKIEAEQRDYERKVDIVNILAEKGIPRKQAAALIDVLTKGDTPDSIQKVISSGAGDMTPEHFARIEAEKRKVEGIAPARRKVYVDSLLSSGEITFEDAKYLLPKAYSFFSYPSLSTPIGEGFQDTQGVPEWANEAYSSWVRRKP